MQKTKFRRFLDELNQLINSIVTDSWSKRSASLLSLLLGFYFTNSLLSFLLDKSVNTILIAILILITMELLIRLKQITNLFKTSLIMITVNNFRIGSTYALILEAYKLGS